ncbi:hypothetical protein [Lentzea californiensis]|uniref:hypothetical protein n=1 Tax=Lentzea californiensis TaxID=438851 RepID=UPI0021648255|nr:hypothetical protein [Lentzea californiensis]MCR3746897.1 hypothetical protein [Lentzea californiensis]
MALNDIPVILSHYKLLITEAPCVKMRELDGGQLVPVVDRNTNEEQFVVVLFAKARPTEGRRKSKGEEIKVNLPRDPGEGFEEGDYVELINPVINTYEMRGEDGKITASGLWFKADGLTPAARIVSAPAA